MKDVRFKWYHYELGRCPLTRERIAGGKSVTNVVAAYLNRANGPRISYVFSCDGCAEVWMTILESGRSLWVWLVGEVSRRWVWLVGGIYEYGYNV